MFVLVGFLLLYLGATGKATKILAVIFGKA